MKTVALSVSESVLVSIHAGDSVVLQAGRKRVRLVAVPSATERKHSRTEIRRACELANAQDRQSDDMSFIERVSAW